jgi:hypothetical protein
MLQRKNDTLAEHKQNRRDVQHPACFVCGASTTEDISLRGKVACRINQPICFLVSTS